MPRTGSGQGGQRGGSRPQPRAAEWPDPRQQGGRGSRGDGAGPQGHYEPQGYYEPERDYPTGYPPQADYQAPWDGAMPEPDPALRYREPGPGMPGYRGSRDARYGGERR
jgi:hypothetical protein